VIRVTSESSGYTRVTCPTYAEVVDDRLSRLDALLAALVDDHLAREGIAPLIEDLGQCGLARQTLACLEQAPQLRVSERSAWTVSNSFAACSCFALSCSFSCLSDTCVVKKSGGRAEQLPRGERYALQADT